MVTIDKKFTIITPVRTGYTPYHRLKGYFAELRKEKKTATPNGPNKINNFDGGSPFGEGNNDGNTQITPLKTNHNLSNIGIAFLASTALTISISKLNALEVFGNKIANFVKTSLSGLSISLGAIALNRFLTQDPTQDLE